MSQEDDNRALIEILYRRLKILKEQKTTLGLQTPASLILQIQDTETEIATLKREIGEDPDPPPPQVPSSTTHPASEPVVASSSPPGFSSIAPSPDSIPDVHIENPHRLDLSAQAPSILNSMFAQYSWVTIKAEFGGGFSGGRVFLVRPHRSERVTELPTVVKMAPRELIVKEWQAYQQYIRGRWPKIAQIEGEPIFPADHAWGGLRYHLVGDGTFDAESLIDYSQTASLPDVRFVLERLLKVVDQVLGQHHTQAEFHFSSSYDSILPVNLWLRPLPPQPVSHTVTPFALPRDPLRLNEVVEVQGFQVVRVNPAKATVTLNTPPSAGPGRGSYLIRLQEVENIEAYQVDQILTSVVGQVANTRLDQLQQEVRDTLGTTYQLSQETITTFAGQSLPNPLAALPTILDTVRDVRIGAIHGDLNLENVLVDAAIRDVSLIDFAEARDDHTLHDYLRLETGIITRLLPAILARANLGAGYIVTFYTLLHQAVAESNAQAETQLPHPDLQKPFGMLVTIRTSAHKYLFAGDWAEYYHGLVLYLLGALRFGNLNELGRLPKQVAFWGAGAVLATSKQVVEPTTRPEPQSNTMKSNPTIPNVAHQQGENMDNDFQELRKFLIKKFSRDDLLDICRLLGVDPEMLPGEGRTKQGLVREMMVHFERKGRIPELIAKSNEVLAEK